MSWSPISLSVPQYEDSNGDPYSGAVLKAYSAGTSTPISMATDSTGATTVGSVALNASGYPEVSGNVIIPHVSANYKLALYPTQAAADANSGALWSVDNLTPLGTMALLSLTTIGDSVVATTAGAAARLAAKADVAAHATTADLWVAREIVLTGSAVTFTDIADAPYVGAVVWVKQNAAHVWTDGAVFDVQGGANYTAAAGDWVRIYATTVSTFEVTIFPAALNYVTGTWTPALTFATPGDLTIAYSTQAGSYTKKGRQVTCWLNLATSAFTHTTASGDVQITGLPFTSAATITNIGILQWSGITHANYSQQSLSLAPSSATLTVVASGSAVGTGPEPASSFPTGGAVILRGCITYNV